MPDTSASGLVEISAATSAMRLYIITATSGGAPRNIAPQNLATSFGSIFTSADEAKLDGITSAATPDQNLYLNVAADAGSTVIASTASATLNILGGTHIDTSATGATDIIQIHFTGNVWSGIQTDDGSASAASTNDQFSIVGGSGIATSATGSIITIENTAVGGNAFSSFQTDAGSASAASSTDQFTLTGGNGIDTSATGSTATFDLGALDSDWGAGSFGISAATYSTNKTITITPTGSADTTSLQNAIDAVFGASAGDPQGSVMCEPGTYILDSQITWRDVNIIGKYTANSSVRFQWDGASAATVFSKPTVTFGGTSFGLLYGIDFVAGLNEPGTWLDVTPTLDDIDILFQINRCHFNGCTNDAIRILGWTNLHWEHLRFDLIGGFAIRSTISSTQDVRSFSLDKFTYDHGRTTDLGEGVICIDNTSAASNAGIVELANGRIELSQAWGGGQGIFTLVDPAGGTTRSVHFLARNITYADGSGMASDNVLFRDTVNTTGRGTLVLDNVVANSMANILGGTWPANQYLPAWPSGGHISYATFNRTTDNRYSETTDGLRVRGVNAATYPVNIAVGTDANERFRMREDGQMEWGNGTSATDTTLARNGPDGLTTGNFEVTRLSSSQTTGVAPFVVTSATTPTSANDISTGLQVGDLWVNTSSDNAFILVSEGTASAVWNQIDAAGAGGNSFSGIQTDQGSASAATAQAQFTLVGGTGIATSATGTTITIENTGTISNAYSSLQADAGSASAASSTDQFTLAGGAGIATSATGNTITIENTAFKFLTVSADTGGVSASAANGSFVIAGGTGISTSATNSTITIVNDSPNVDQNVYTTIQTDQGSAAADTTTDQLGILGGVGISTSATDDNITIENTAVKWTSIQTDAGSASAASVNAQFSIVGGTGISTSATGTTITIENTGAGGNAYSSLQADAGSASAASSTDQFTISGGTGISTSATGSTITVVNDLPFTAADEIKLDGIAVGANVVATTSATDPAVTDDVSAGFSIGALWINTSANTAYILVSAATASAVWNQIDAAGAAGNSFSGIQTDAGSASAATSQAQFTLLGGAGISTSATGTTITIENDTNIFNTIAADAGANTVADQIGDTLTLAGGIGLATSSDPATDTIQFNLTQNLFSSIQSDQGSASAASTSDQLSIVGGTGIATSATGTTITIENTGTVGNAYSSLQADAGSASAATSTDQFVVAGGTGIATSATGSTITVVLTQPTWDTIGTDAGNANPDTVADSLGILGGTGISTSATGDNVTIENTAVKWTSIQTDQGSASAATINAQFTLAGGTGISTSATGTTITIENTQAATNAYSSIQTDQGSASAASSTDQFTLAGGTSISTSATGQTITIVNDAPNVDQNLFETVATDAGNAVADTTTDTLTLTGGQGLATSATGDTVTIDLVQNLWSGIQTDAGSASAADTSDQFTLAGGFGLATSATGTTITIDAASASVGGVGVIEVATTAEVSAGTDAQRAITPAGFAGSRYSTLGLHSIWVPSPAMTPETTLGAGALTLTELSASTPNINVLPFDAAQDEGVQFTVAFPNSWNLSTVTYQAYWTSTHTGTNGVAWALEAQSRGTGEAIEVQYSAAAVVQTDNMTTGANELQITTTSSPVTIADTPANEELVWFRFFRDVSDAGDTMTEDALLLGVKLNYTTDQGTDA